MSETQHSPHQAVWALLPWLANGTATPAQRQTAEAHLQGCADCRAELARETALAQHLAAASTVAPPLEAGLARLMQRLDQAESAEQAAAAPVPAWPRGRASAPRRPRFMRPVGWAAGWAWRPAAVAVAAVGLLELGALAAAGLWWWQRPGTVQAPAAYRTLSSDPVAQAPQDPTTGPRWRVVFADNARVHDMQRLLQQQGLRLVAGPSEAGVFTLAAAQAQVGASASADAQAQLLRQSPLVRFAEVQTATVGAP